MQEIKELIRLDYQTGDLFWLPRSAKHFVATGIRDTKGCANNWNSRYAHKPCLTCIGNHGYKRGNFLGNSLLAHRAVFYIVNGFMPKYVDHINGNKLDNRPINLRQATNSENIANSKSRKNSSSKYLGVCWSKKHDKWVVHITKDYKQKYLGLFESEVDAAKAYNLAAIKLHKQYSNLNHV